MQIRFGFTKPDRYYRIVIRRLSTVKRSLKILSSLALVFVLAGSIPNVAQAHSGHHSRLAKSIHMTVYTPHRNQVAPEANNSNNIAAVTDDVVATPAVPESAPTPAYATCYENGYCTGNNLCDVNGVCQNGGICNGVPCPNAPCYQDETCYPNNNYGHHGGGHHGGRHHR